MCRQGLTREEQDSLADGKLVVEILHTKRRFVQKAFWEHGDQNENALCECCTKVERINQN
jgi:hypothetical protein